MANENFIDPEELRAKYGQLHPVAAWEAVYTDPEGKHVGIVLTPESYPGQVSRPMVFLFERYALIETARGILREIDPTPEDEILATLRRIEERR